MKNSKRKTMLLVAFILGIIGLVIIMFPWIVSYQGSITTGNSVITQLKVGFSAFYGPPTLVVLPGSSIAVIIFLIITILTPLALLGNIFSWLKNGMKQALIAAILYLFSLNIPSAVLCFICFKKLRRENIEGSAMRNNSSP